LIRTVCLHVFVCVLNTAREREAAASGSEERPHHKTHQFSTGCEVSLTAELLVGLLATLGEMLLFISILPFIE